MPEMRDPYPYEEKVFEMIDKMKKQKNGYGKGGGKKK